MGAPFPHAYGLIHIVFYHMLKFICLPRRKYPIFFIEMFYLRLPLPYYNKRITRVAKIKKKKQENTAYHNVLIVQS